MAKGTAKKTAKSPAKKAATGKKPVAKKPAAKEAKVKPAPKGKAAPAKSAQSAPAKPAPETKKPDAKKKAPPAKGAPAKVEAKTAKGSTPPGKGGKPAAPAAGKPQAATPAGEDKAGRKGITIVNKPAKKPASKPSQIKMPEYGTPLGQTIRKPLIASGPGAPKQTSLAEAASDKPRKSPFGAKDLAYYRQLLLTKRAELIGDVSSMESEALTSQSGSLSNLPQHMAEQGSDAYGQSLSLDLAAADRKLIKEIDDALQRIADGTFGVCELTGKPIRKERLEELPWARYSIEAARELERRNL